MATPLLLTLATSVLIALAACGGGLTTEDAGADAGGDAGACAELPICSTPEPPSAAYGLACNPGLGAGWNGGDGGVGQPSCCLDGQRYAACIQAALLGEPCDPAAPASCHTPFLCSASSPGCAGGPCCVTP